MPRYKILLEYDGTRYSGWQLQKGERTVQGAFFDACKKIFGDKKFEFYGAGRTDSGVHAIGQVAHLDVKTDMTPQKLVFALNDNLPSDVNVLDAIIAEPNFHARYDATARSYVYVISHVRTAFCKGNVWWVRDNLDQNKMAMAAKLLTGFKDYKSFTDKNAETESTKVDVKYQAKFHCSHTIPPRLPRRMTCMCEKAGILFCSMLPGTAIKQLSPSTNKSSRAFVISR